MSVLRRSAPAHPVFRGLFDDWYARAGVLSAMPDAPVAADGSRPKRPARSPLPARPERQWSLARLGRGRTS
ncbi:hypothetical protein [Streptomyces sp. NPDC006012]|uniref:hypothetical protein n=1 Tax=Streptomyces sp. NPDC006012 TaxID=3364739 RepID=UPI0036C4D4C1